MSTQEPVVYNGRYEVQRRIARGGMADVFLARDLLLARPVAVKVLFPQFAGDPAFVARFRREAQAAANLNHANIVGVYDWGQEGGTYYIVMEYVDGKSLSEILRTEGLPPPDAAAGIAADVSAALGFAHRNGVVHRDVKPGNIMITTSGHVKVADFGIARAMHGGSDEPLTQTGSVMGTATYFSPEQAQGHDVDPRSDLYSLGVVMYEMATGKPPFVGDSPVAIAYKHVQEPPAAPRTLNPAVPAGYEAICLKLLAKNPDDRYPSAEALRADLRRFMQGEPIAVTVPAAATVAVAATHAKVPPVMPTSAERRAHQPAPPTVTASRHTGWFIVILLVLLVALGGLLFAFAKTLGLTDNGAKVSVPFVVRKPSLVAIKDLTEAGLGYQVGEAVDSASVPKNYVVSQTPEGGSRVAKHTKVTIIVSNGPPAPANVNLPDVTNPALTFDAAQALLQNLGFVVTRANAFSDTVPANTVVSMEPVGGPAAQFPRGQPVTLYVSQGPDPNETTVPPSTQPVTTTTGTTEPPPTTPTTQVTQTTVTPTT